MSKGTFFFSSGIGREARRIRKTYAICRANGEICGIDPSPEWFSLFASDGFHN